MNRTEAGRVVASMMAASPTQAAKLDRARVESMINTYADLLDDISYEHANAALRVLLQTRTWMPSVAEIRATVIELVRGPVRASGDAWGSVLDSIRRYGAYRSPGVDFQFQDPLVARCVASMGWQSLCLSESSVADRSRFCDLYDKLATQSLREAQAPLLEIASAAREDRIASVADLTRQLAETKKAAP